MTAKLDIDLTSGTRYNPFEQPVLTNVPPTSANVKSSALNWKKETNDTFNNWDALYDRWNNGQQSTEAQSQQLPNTNSDICNPDRDLFDDNTNIISNTCSAIQFKNKYLLSPAKSGLIIIDQHRAHVRILFDQFLKAVQTSSVASQSLIFPEILNTTSSQDIIINEILTKLKSIGFDIVKAGKGS